MDEHPALLQQNMLNERDDFIDLVAQTVLDKLEERDRLTGLVAMVAMRVRELQQEEEQLRVEDATPPVEEAFLPR